MLSNGFKCQLTIAGEDFGRWDGFDGGEADADETKYTPEDDIQRTYITNVKVSNLTVKRGYLESRDGDISRRYKSLVGQPFTAVILERDDDGNFQQNRPPYTGRVKNITLPNGDSNENSKAMLSIELSVGEPGS